MIPHYATVVARFLIGFSVISLVTYLAIPDTYTANATPVSGPVTRPNVVRPSGDSGSYLDARFYNYFEHSGIPRTAVRKIQLSTALEVDAAMIAHFQLTPRSARVFLRNKEARGCAAKDFIKILAQVTDMGAASLPYRAGPCSQIYEKLRSSWLPSAFSARPLTELSWWPPDSSTLDRLTVYEGRLEWNTHYVHRGAPYWVLFNPRTGMGYLLGY